MFFKTGEQGDMRDMVPLFFRTGEHGDMRDMVPLFFRTGEHEDMRDIAPLFLRTGEHGDMRDMTLLFFIGQENMRTVEHEIWLGLKAQHAWIETCENLTWEYTPCIYA